FLNRLLPSQPCHVVHLTDSRHLFGSTWMSGLPMRNARTFGSLPRCACLSRLAFLLFSYSRMGSGKTHRGPNAHRDDLTTEHGVVCTRTVTFSTIEMRKTGPRLAEAISRQLSTIQPRAGKTWTHGYGKECSTGRQALETFAVTRSHGEARRCERCL